MVTDAGANVIARHDFLPFGEELPPNSAGRSSQWGPGTDNVSQKFTGQIRDEETKLDYFNARYFGAALGRFTSPDPQNAGANLAVPQSWNGYSYVLNNPLVNTDPTGMFLSAHPYDDSPYLDMEFASPRRASPLQGNDPSSGYPSSRIFHLATGGSSGGTSTPPAAPQSPSPPVSGRAPATPPAPIPPTPPPPDDNSPTKVPPKNVARPDWLNNITSIFGYDQRINLPSCAALAFSTAVDDLNPFSPGAFGAIKDGVDGGLVTGQFYYFNAAISHAAARGLIYPNKSSIFRGLLKTSGNLGKAAGDYLGPAAVDAGLLHGFIQEMIAMSRGECQ